jgi:uncharacterized protein (DUF488 family)
MNTLIFTIGHGSRTFDEVAEVLRRYGVAMVVDVRSQPYSRHAPDFSKSRLETLAAAAGLGYRWMGDALGGRPADPALAGPDGRLEHEAIRNRPAYRAGLDVVGAMAEGAGIVLLCAEETPEHCHRATLLAPDLIALGHRVSHLRADGNAVPHQEPLEFA